MFITAGLFARLMYKRNSAEPEVEEPGAAPGDPLDRLRGRSVRAVNVAAHAAGGTRSLRAVRFDCEDEGGGVTLRRDPSGHGLSVHSEAPEPEDLGADGRVEIAPVTLGGRPLAGEVRAVEPLPAADGAGPHGVRIEVGEASVYVYSRRDELHFSDSPP
jgi:hypothetical protein